MKKSNPPNKEVVGDQLIEDISKIKHIVLGEGAAACQVCGRKLREGDELTAYAFRAAGNPIFAVGYVMCGTDDHEHPSVFTRGVHELVVTGRIGVCTDVTTQSSWLILIEPSPVVTSVASSNTARVVDGASRETAGRCTDDAERQEGPTPLLTAARNHMRADGGGE